LKKSLMVLVAIPAPHAKLTTSALAVDDRANVALELPAAIAAHDPFAFIAWRPASQAQLALLMTDRGDNEPSPKAVTRVILEFGHVQYFIESIASVAVCINLDFCCLARTVTVKAG
jgi:hypothetical protein